MKESNFVSLVIYLKNSENEIEEFLLNIDAKIKENFKLFEYILVDDFSTDSTVEMVKKLSSKIEGNITLIELPWKHGVERAIEAGIDIAIGDFVFEFDTIIVNYNYEKIIDIYKKCLEGYDIVAASSNQKLKLTSKLFYNLLNYFSAQNFNIKTETFRIISRRAINRIYKSDEKFKYRKILYHYSGFDTQVLEYIPENNKKIHAKQKINDKLNLASDILVVFSEFGFKIAFGIALFFILGVIFVLIYTIYSYIFKQNIQAGWTTIMIFLSFSFSGIFFMLSIIMKYLNILVKEVQNRDAYTYKKISKLN